MVIHPGCSSDQQLKVLRLERGRCKRQSTEAKHGDNVFSMKTSVYIQPGPLSSRAMSRGDPSGAAEELIMSRCLQPRLMEDALFSMASRGRALPAVVYAGRARASRTVSEGAAGGHSRRSQQEATAGGHSRRSQQETHTHTPSSPIAAVSLLGANRADAAAAGADQWSGGGREDDGDEAAGRQRDSELRLRLRSLCGGCDHDLHTPGRPPHAWETSTRRGDCHTPGRLPHAWETAPRPGD
uniref:Uncharacterized protein n=1 Tax=Knipowitschia caucasica TaxID=637954 RepID=A0AAV2IY59_KNICA